MPFIVSIFRYLEKQRRRANRQREEIEREHRVNEGIMAKWTRKVGIFTIILVVVTSISTVIAGLQTWAFIQSERASVTVTSASPETGVLQPDKPLVWVLMIQNSGHGQANIFDGNASVRFDETLLPTPDYAKEKGFRAIIPGNTSFRSTARSGTAITKEDLGGVNGGDKPLYIFGYLAYRDSFSWLLGPKKSGFCFIYNPLNDPSKGPMFDVCGPEATAYIYDL